jgi:endonuclease/exonuclease/phosphatase family metal-dependent hydrolase
MKKKEFLVLMTMFILLIIFTILLAGILVFILQTSYDTSSKGDAVDSISIASWNLQNFGSVKAENESLLEFYASTLDDYDVFVIQEINDPAMQAIQSFAEKLPTYQYVISNPAGQGSSKEQYAIFYNSNVALLNTTDWTEKEQENFERPPYEATFMVKNWTFTLYTIHVKVNNVPEELTNLEHLIGTPTQDTILLGDLNADGDQYYNGVLHHFLHWHWVITSEMDTTVAKSSNALDRIILNAAAENNFTSSGIVTDVTVSQSDHYLVYALFNPNQK